MKKFFSFVLLSIVSSAAYGNFVEVSGCQEADFVLADIQSSVAFNGDGYTPKCLKVEIGSEVTIAASKKHPLAPQSSSANSPIVLTEQTKTYTFDQTGFYGYFCTKHGSASGKGMAGTIWVVESL